MISRISPIICSHATAIPSDEGRVYSLVRTRPAPVRPVQFQKDTYADFAQDRFPKMADPAAKLLAPLHNNTILLLSWTIRA
jgi:hypothetical protein